MNIYSQYDVAIIGGGTGGLFSAYQLVKYNKNLSIVIIDRGHNLDERKCPASNGGKCVKCKVCAITNGLAGAGAFSDAKFNLGTAYGGILGEELDDAVANNYIEQVDSILQEFAEDYPKIYGTSEDLKLLCLQNNLRLLDMNVRHLGTDRNIVTMRNLIAYLLKNNVCILSDTECFGVSSQSRNKYFLKVRNVNDEYSISASNLIVATGRGGAEFVKNLCNYLNVDIDCNSVDIGVRVEMPDIIWKSFSDQIYEPKIVYKTDTFEDNCRMFCFNQGGIVAAENNSGIITANGHSYADPNKKTENCNFAVLSSINFTEPFNQPTEYAESIAKMANMIGNGNVIVQRFGDLIRGRRTTENRLSKNTVRPTLQATAGDVSLVLPHRILTNIIETIYALDKVAPGTANDDTLLYGCESKYYSLKPKHNDKFEIAPNVYLIGDGSGITRGLSQAAAMGLYVADNILGKAESDEFLSAWKKIFDKSKDL